LNVKEITNKKPPVGGFLTKLETNVCARSVKKKINKNVTICQIRPKGNCTPVLRFDGSSTALA
jgi:hypothetical protein